MVRPRSTGLCRWMLVLAAAASGAPGARADGEPATAVTSHLARIGLDPEGGIDATSLTIAPRDAHVALRAAKEGAFTWLIDGKAGKPHAEVGSLAFSDDGMHWAHFARTGEKTVLVVDGEERDVGPLAPSLQTLRYVPGGRRLAYLGVHAGGAASGRTSLVVDGVAGPPFVRIAAGTLVFSADGKRSAFVAGPDAKQEYVVVDGKPGTAHPIGSVEPPLFSADGTRYAYVVEAPGAHVVVDGVDGPPWDKIVSLHFAPVGARYLYAAVTSGPALVVDGKGEPPFQDLAQPGPIFSPDGAHVGYTALKSGGRRVVIDGRDAPVFPRIGAESLTFSPDGTRHGYWAGKGPKPFFVIDGVPQPEFDVVGEGRALAFSPDSKRYAYRVRRGAKWLVVTDGVEGPPTEGIGAEFPVFTPDSAHVVYEAVSGGKWHVYVDGKPGAPYDAFIADTLSFGQDGASVGVVARRGASHRIVVDGVEGGEEYAALLPGSGLVSNGPRSFDAWVVRTPELLHVRVTLGAVAPR